MTNDRRTINTRATPPLLSSGRGCVCLGPMICVTLDLGRPNGGDLITQERIISTRQLCSREPPAPLDLVAFRTRNLAANHNRRGIPGGGGGVSIGWVRVFGCDAAPCDWVGVRDVRGRVVILKTGRDKEPRVTPQHHTTSPQQARRNDLSSSFSSSYSSRAVTLQKQPH
ncbi:hypothetical protein E2C01_097545 [Portunus trituberculatus]|uniref:Uncharacterized protein n=1 Tax=Portunus trituberculatus TaxID=210409 RepID=A0A5B7JYX0_PORTR|nr:hypothetical protein [Portunus trituberculatus]